MARKRPHLHAAMIWILACVSTAVFVLVARALQPAPTVQKVTGVALSRAGVFLLLYFPINLGVMMRFGGIRIKDLWLALRNAILSAVAAAAVAGLVGQVGWLRALPPWAALVFLGAPSTAAAAAVLLGMDIDLRERVLKAVKPLFGKGETAQ